MYWCCVPEKFTKTICASLWFERYFLFVGAGFIRARKAARLPMRAGINPAPTFPARKRREAKRHF